MKQVFFLSLLLFLTAILFAFVPVTITGIVSDDSGKPIPYVSVTIKGTNKGVSTNIDGSFSIAVNDDKAVLVISAVGFLSKEIKLGKDKKLIIHLEVSKETLKEVVVTGYGTMMKTDMTGSIAGRTFSGTLLPRAQANITSLGNLSVAGNVAVGSLHGLVPNTYVSGEFNREGYDHITENGFSKVLINPLSTFSIDVDAASYSNIRRILKSGRLPQQGAVRIEEMINYFSYEYAQPTGKDPFAVHTEIAVCPWNTQHQLVLIGLQGKKMDVDELPPSNLTFLIDVSGSMMTPDKLPLVQASLKLLVDQLRPVDKVAIVAYAGNAGLVLSSTDGDRKIMIKEAIDRLEAGGSTAGGEGIQLAYKIAKENFNKEGNNRVILCTDGDFNVGVSSDDALEKMIEEERKSGVYLTVLGFGTGNYQDAKMQKLADKGNGNHAYIDQLSEAKKVLISEFGGTLYTIAKDVKLQVEFNPKKVQAYRLIGYENRMLAKEDFNNDKKDAGDLGSGHTVTALYELIPPGVEMPGEAKVDSLRYQVSLPAITTEQAKFADEVLNIKLRYKQPDSEISSLLSVPLKGKVVVIDEATDNFRFATAVASFGMLLRNSEYKGDVNYHFIKTLAERSMRFDIEGYRKEFIQLVDAASEISRKKEMAFDQSER